MDATRASWGRWLLTGWLGGASSVLVAGLAAVLLDRLTPDMIRFDVTLCFEPLHGGDRVGSVASVMVILGTCFMGAWRALRRGTASFFWTSVAMAEVIRWAPAPWVLGGMLLHPSLRQCLPASKAIFATSVFLWWPVLLLASLASAAVQIRRLPVPRTSRMVWGWLGAAVAVLLLLSLFERSTPSLYYSRLMWNNLRWT